MHSSGLKLNVKDIQSAFDEVKFCAHFARIHKHHYERNE